MIEPRRQVLFSALMARTKDVADFGGIHIADVAETHGPADEGGNCALRFGQERLEACGVVRLDKFQEVVDGLIEVPTIAKDTGLRCVALTFSRQRRRTSPDTLVRRAERAVVFVVRRNEPGICHTSG